MDDDRGGFVKVYRSILDWEWWDDPNTLKMLIYCLLKANYVEKSWHGIEIPRGSFITSYTKMSLETKMTVRQVRTSLNHLISTHEVTKSSTAKYTLITVTNFDAYQSNRQDERQGTDKVPTNNRQGTDKVPTTTKKDKKDKEGKEGKENNTETQLAEMKEWLEEYMNDGNR